MFSSHPHMECSFCYLLEGDLSCKKYTAQPIMCLDIHHKINVMTNEFDEQIPQKISQHKLKVL